MAASRDPAGEIRLRDYADTCVPVLRAMRNRRVQTYRALGFGREQV